MANSDTRKSLPLQAILAPNSGSCATSGDKDLGAREPGRVQSRTTTERVRDKENSPVSKSKRLKPGSQFFVTLHLSIPVYDQIRQDFVESFQDLITYCCAVERSQSSLHVSNHLHCFLEFSEPILINDLRVFIESTFKDFYTTLDLQACRSKRNILKYITKEDNEPYFNCSASKLNFYYQVHNWARNTKYFCFDDPFVVQHKNQYNYLSKVFKSIKQRAVGQSFSGFKYVYDVNLGWPYEAAMVWNDMLHKHGIKKRKVLYLWGSSNTGKTSLIERFIGYENLRFVFYPGVGKFFLQDYNPLIHKVIVFEEFNIQFYPSSMLKRLLEGRSYAYPVKCSSDINIVHKGPIVFISNFFDINDDALLNRLVVINAEIPYWTLPMGKVPKVEVEETIEITSSPETSEI